MYIIKFLRTFKAIKFTGISLFLLMINLSKLIFKEKIIHKVLESLFKTYSERVPDVKITNGLIKFNVIEKQEDIINDHIAFVQ